MSGDRRPTGVPCPICLTRIEGYDHTDAAQPCGHTADEIHDEALRFILTTPRARFGEHAREGIAR